jgi:uncharacterized membrane protein YdjX (TVP38/TMEM64 family)
MIDTGRTHFMKWLWGLLLAGIILWAILAPDSSQQLQELMDNIQSIGPLGILLFILCYVAATLILIPGFILTLGAGAAFGIWKGFILVSLASTLAASVAFLVGRHLAGNWVLKNIGNAPRINALKHAIESEGWKVVVLARLSPAIPFTMLNYIFSLTSLRFTHYVIASWIGMIPGTLAYVYLGSLGNLGNDGEKTGIEWMLIGAGIIATVTVTILISRAAATEMAKKLEEN